MTLRYFELSEDVQAGTWYLGDPVDDQGQEVEDPWQFRAGRPVSISGRLTVPIDQQGRALDFSTAGVGLAPVVHVQVASVFAELAPEDVQFIPVRIKGMPDQYVILVATKCILCIDEQASAVQFWTAEDGLPEKVGSYYAVDDLHIDVKKVGTTKVFRTEGWKIALIVSEDIKHALERIRATGVRFTPV
ncbi:imm11 family protein [Corallococcus exercitus]|uniref:imm11 family protein n=1 Tax=Corallococcus exercitus TaxID=2316736 RepID=UPI0035D44BD6